MRTLTDIRNDPALHTTEGVDLTPDEVLCLFRELTWTKFGQLYGLRGHHARYRARAHDGEGLDLVSSVQYGTAPAGRYSIIAEYCPGRLRFCNSPVDVTVTTDYLCGAKLWVSDCSWFDVHLRFDAEGYDTITLCFVPDDSEKCRSWWASE